MCQFSFLLDPQTLTFFIPLPKLDRQSLSSRVVAILDLTSDSLTLFTKKCEMLHVLMKVTNEKKGIFILFIYCEQKISMRAISITVLMTNESEDIH